MTRDDDFNYHVCDEKFTHFSAHLDKTLISKIENGEFIELEELLPKEKCFSADHRLEPLVWLPVKDRELSVINSFRKWDKAFHIYSGIYSKTNPTCASELVQYVSSVKTAADTFVWENIYLYDQTFRHLMAEYPRQNWGVVYQNGWSIFLKDHHNASTKSAFQSIVLEI